jgi:hypothetical protein
VQKLFSGKYEVLMIEDMDEDGASSSGVGGMGGLPSSSVGTARGLREGPRVAFQIIPGDQVGETEVSG